MRMTTGTAAILGAILGALLGAILLVAPAAAQAQPLKTAVDGTFAPHAFPDMQGGVQGFNVDLAKEIGRKLKREVTVDAAQFSGLLPALQAGTYDFIIAPVTVTKERAESLLFPEGYLNTDFQFLVRKDGPDIKSLEELKGKVVSVNRGSAYDSWARGLEEKIGWKVESFGTQADAVQAVIAGRAQANVAGNTVIAWAAKQNPQVKLSYLHSTGLVWSAAVRKDNAADARPARDRDRVPEAGGRDREAAREMVRHRAGRGLRRRDRLPRHRRARHAGLRPRAAHARSAIEPSSFRGTPKACSPEPTVSPTPAPSEYAKLHGLSWARPLRRRLGMTAVRACHPPSSTCAAS